MPRRDDDEEDDFDGDDDVDVKRKKRKGGNSEAAGRLAGPAITLIVFGVLSAIGFCIGVPFNVYQATQPAVIAPQGDFGAQFQGNPIGGAIYGVVATLVSAFVVFGAIQMKNAKMYGVSLAAAIISVIPCLSPCICLGIPFGIWALIVLMDQDVKSAFTS